jgi:hypothetical protein
MTARNWRPHFLVFVGNIERRIDLVRFGALLSENRGVVTVCELVKGLPSCFFVHNGSLFVGELITAEAPATRSKIPVAGNHK